MSIWLILLIVILLVRFVLPGVLRLALGSLVRKQMRNGGFGVPPQPPTGPPPAPGQVRVDFVPPPAAPEKPAGFKGGEYVDYEEVK